MHALTSSLLDFGPLVLVASYALGGLLVGRRDPLRRAEGVSRFALGVAVLVSATWLLRTGGAPVTVGLPELGDLGPSIRLDVVTALMTLLVGFIGVIIIRFSRAYLAGEPRQRHYVRWIMATLTAVSVLVTTNNLLWLGAAWVGTSLALHQLLTFYRERPRARLAAREKFIVSRIADACLLTGVGLVSAASGTVQIDGLHAWAATVDTLPVTAEVAALLFVLGASLKCAQLPFHGWLTRVMEAPTPVSALLHAGVVNIGGFLMIRLAPLMVLADAAQALLVAIGSVTVVVAALVMMTRTSIKVSLAWSTCAQMGFMLVQCGLGAYSLALLHLLAHSLYKAHSFLSTGSTVERWRVAAMAPRPAASPLRWLGAAALALGLVAGVGTLAGVDLAREPSLAVFGLLLALSCAPLLGSARGLGATLRAAVAAAAVAGLYFGWHATFGAFDAVALEADVGRFRLGLAGAAFTVLFLLTAALLTRPDGAVARALYPTLAAGLHLDHRFTQLTLWLWPTKTPAGGLGAEAKDA